MKKTRETIEYIYPIKIVEEVKCDNSETLLLKKPLLHTVNETDICEIERGGYVILDFGAEYAGGIRILTAYHSDPNNALPMRIRFGESLGEVMHDVGYKGTTNDHSLRDIIVKVPMMSDQSYGESGFRFVRLDNVSETSVTIKSIVLSYRANSAKEMGYFECDDEELNRIFEVSNRTAHLCIQNGYLVDGIKRDRLVWCGDMNINIRTLLNSYGDLDVLYRSVESSVQNMQLPNWMNDIPTYSLWWILNVYALYVYNGNKKWVKRFLPYIFGIIKQIDRCIKEDGTLDFSVPIGKKLEMEFFIDWSTYGSPYCRAAVNFLVAYTLEKAKAFFAESTFIDEIISKLKLERLPADAPLELLAIESMYDQLTIFDQQHFEQKSTFLSYFVYKSIRKTKNIDLALQMLKKYYGGMLRLGATTFFEAFDTNWSFGKIDSYTPEEKYFHESFGEHCYGGYRLSLCHAWSSGPSPFLIEEILGIHRLDEKTYEIKPDLGPLKFAKGGCMSKYGRIEVEIYRNSNREYLIDLKYPKEIIIKNSRDFQKE